MQKSKEMEMENSELLATAANKPECFKAKAKSGPKFAKRPLVDIEFQNLTYTVRSSSGKRQLLKGVNGKFKAGDFTAILGPSGAGKSTLLNVLAGYVTAGVSGTIKANDRPREMKRFHKLSSYIMQEDLLQPRLTVHEAMMISANLKLEPSIDYQEKLNVVNEVLSMLGLLKCAHTRTEEISGGQRKRLSVALELVSNPPVIFLDEPTSGLDTFAIKQSIEVFKTLADQGRTIICTIHQPSASLFQEFDQVYFMSAGSCVFNGSPNSLVPFMSSVGYTCPTTYNPADYIIEMVQSNEENASILSQELQNGRINKRHPDSTNFNLSSMKVAPIDSSIHCIYKETTQTVDLVNFNFPTSFWTQCSILLRRMFLQMSRNKTMLWIQFFHHLISGLLLGGIFYGIGNDAQQALSNFRFCVSVMVFFMYTHVMVPVLIFPTEVKLLKREYFNRWYGLKAYYVALTISTLPLSIVFGTMFIIITYLLSYQPWEWDRFSNFAMVALLIALGSEGMGICIGSIFSITNGSVVGPTCCAPLLALCVYGMGYGTAIEPMMTFFMQLSYMRYGVVGICGALYNNRPLLECNDELYCHYKDPMLLMRDLGMANSSFSLQIIALCLFIFLYRFGAYLALRYRLTAEFSNKILNYATKILRHK